MDRSHQERNVFFSADHKEACFSKAETPQGQRLLKLATVAFALLALLSFGQQVSASVPASGQERVGFFPIRVCGKYGYIDNTGRVVIKPQFDDAGSFSEGLAAVMVDMKLGYIDRTGKHVIKPWSDRAGDFSEGVAPVDMTIGGKYGYIGKTGKVVLRPHDSAGSFSQGLAPFKLGGRWFEHHPGRCGYVNRAGAYVFVPQFNWAGSFSAGLAPVQLDEMYDYVDKTGASVIAPQFDKAEDFSAGLAQVAVGGKVGYINRAGESVWEPSQ